MRSHTHTQYVESDTETDDDDSQQHPTFHLLQHTQSKFSHLSINNKNKSTSPTELDEDAHCIQPPAPPTLDANEEKSFQILQNIIQGGQVEKLKVEQCKLYLRRHGLRLTGKKDILINRIKEHLSIVNGEGEHKYPASSFVMNCKGDACTGDVVMFEQNVYEMFSIASRSATGPPCGQRTVAGRIVKESYGAAKQQHTFTIEVLWSKGTKPLPPLHPLLIKGRNLYRLKTMRQRWEDESERHKILSEKHARGNVARTNRETRLHEKEIKKTLRASKGNIKNEKQEAKRPTIPIVSSRTSIQHANASFMERMDHGASHKENMMPNTSRGLDGPLRKNFQVEQNIKNGKQEYKGKASSTRHPEIPSIQHSGAPFMGMDYGAPYRENMNPNTLRGVDYDRHMRQVEQNMGLYPSRLFQRHDYDRQNLPKSYSFQQVGNNGYLPRDHYYQGKRQQLCRLYAQGRCHYGTNCKYLH